METTFPSLATNSSNCSRMYGVMWALTWAERFSRVMQITRKPNKNPRGPGGVHGVMHHKETGGGQTLWVGGKSRGEHFGHLGLEPALGFHLDLELLLKRNPARLPLVNGLPMKP